MKHANTNFVFLLNTDLNVKTQVHFLVWNLLHCKVTVVTLSSASVFAIASATKWVPWGYSHQAEVNIKGNNRGCKHRRSDFFGSKGEIFVMKLKFSNGGPWNEKGSIYNLQNQRVNHYKGHSSAQLLLVLWDIHIHRVVNPDPRPPLSVTLDPCAWLNKIHICIVDLKQESKHTGDKMHPGFKTDRQSFFKSK